VVVSDTPGAREVVRGTGMGEIFPLENVPALAEALARVLTHPTVYVKPPDQIAAIFSLERTVDGYMALLEASVKRP